MNTPRQKAEEIVELYRQSIMRSGHKLDLVKLIADEIGKVIKEVKREERIKRKQRA